MKVMEIAPGLWRWTGLHPDWTREEGGPEGWQQEVGCVYYEAPDAVVLIDPLVPPEEPGQFWEALDRDVERARRPLHVLVTVYWHARSAREIVARYGGRLWAHKRARRPVENRVGPVTDVFRIGDELPGGVRALDASRGGEVIFWIPEHRALVPGDVILGGNEGGLRLCPESWLAKGVGHGQLRAQLCPLLDLPVERVLVSHGEPVLENARQTLEALLAPH